MSVTLYRFLPLECHTHWLTAERDRKRMVLLGR
jgi:hypothetical protein